MRSFEPINRLKPCRHGVMLYNIHDVFTGRSLDLYGEWSEGEILLFQQFLKPGMVVVEAGANIGSHTVPLAQAVGIGGRVLAFEPQRVVFQTLCANLALNNVTNVDCRHAAVGDVPGELLVPRLDYGKPQNFGALALEPVSRSHSPAGRQGGEGANIRSGDTASLALRVGMAGETASLALRVGMAGETASLALRVGMEDETASPALRVGNMAGEGERVAVLTIDGFDLARCDLLKIDVEGMEQSVLAGARETIARCQPVLYVENERKDRSAELIRAIDALGYEMYWHCPPMFNPNNFAKNPVDVFPGKTSVNMLCLPRQRNQQVTGFQRVKVP